MSLSNTPASSYSEGGPSAWVRYYCYDCDHEWEVEVSYDMGAWTIEGDTRCPNCKKGGKQCLAG